MPPALDRLARALRAGLVALAVCVGSGGAQAQEAALRAPLSAQMRLTGAQGAPLDLIQPGQPFDVGIEFTSALGAVPGDLAPMAWLRDRSSSDLPCGESAAAFRAAGRASIGSVDLNGVVLGVVMEDGALTILDPERALGTANLLAAHRFDPPPQAIAADPVTGQFLVSLAGRGAQEGQVLAMTPYGETAVLARGLDRPGPLVASVAGGGWVLEEERGDVLRLHPDRRPQRIELDARQIAGDGDSQPARRLAVLSPDRLTVLEDDGRIAVQTPAPGAQAVGLTSEAALWLSLGALHVIWLDAPDQPTTIPLPGDFDRLAVSPQGRIVYLHAQGRTGFGIVDLALGRLVQGAGTDSPVAEIAFLPDTAMLRLADGSGVGVMDLRQIDPGAEAVVGHVALGQPYPAAPNPAAREGAGRAGASLLAPLLPEPAILAVHASSYSGFVLNGSHAISGKPPMEAMRLRGGIPRHVRALDRSMRQTAPGRFTAAARLPRPGDWELVVSTGLGQLAFCAPVPTLPAPAQVATTGRIDVRSLSDGRLQLRFVAPDGTPAAALTGMLELAALTSNWRARQGFTTDAEGLTAKSYDLRARLPLVVTARHTTLRGRPAGFAPLVLEEIR